MKTSNKLIIGSGITILLGIFAHTFIMRGAYLDALKHPLEQEGKISLKAVKKLNLLYTHEVVFEKGDKYEIIVNRIDKDSLTIQYYGETLNLDLTKAGSIKIICPKLPTLVLDYKKPLNDGDYPVNIDSTFQYGNLKATFLKRGILNLHKCMLDSIDIKSKVNPEITFEGITVKNCNIDLPAHSVLNIYYSYIQSKNVVLGDSSTFNLVGKHTHATFIK